MSNYTIGTTGTIKFGDNSIAKVIIKNIDTYSYMPTDYWLDYQEGEMNKQLVHPEYGSNPIIKAEILLPEGLLDKVFTPDNLIEDEYAKQLAFYLATNFNQEDVLEASLLFNKLEKLKGRQHIINEYFNKSN